MAGYVAISGTHRIGFLAGRVAMFEGVEGLRGGWKGGD